MIKFLLTLFLIYLLVTYVFPTVMRIFFRGLTANNQQQRPRTEYRQTGRNANTAKSAAQARPDYRKFTDKAGDYIDYEEVK